MMRREFHSQRTTAILEVGGVLALCALFSSCGPTIRPSFDSPEPAARNAAIVKAAGAQDVAATPNLIRMLRSDDPSTRLLAIETLEQLHGTTMGYDSGDDPWKRAIAIRKWEGALRDGTLDSRRSDASVQSTEAAQRK